MVSHPYLIFHGSSNSTWWTEFLLTLRTAEWFFISMNSFMPLPSIPSENLFSHFEQLNGFSTVWTLSCVIKLCERLNFFSHFKHLNGFSLVWILSCIFKCCDWLNFFHTLSSWMVFHRYEFFCVSSNCVNTWTSFHTLSTWMVFHQHEFFHVSSNAEWLNFFSHFEQLNGFSSIWILLWCFKLCERLNFFSHFEQLNGFSSVWILSCDMKYWMTELLSALWATEWVFISMNSSMCLQIVETAELLFTLWAAEWFFISMNSFMCLQMLWLTEHHEHFMFFQTTWLTEILLTLWAAEWFIFSMNSFMSLPSTAIWEFTQFEQLKGFSSVWILSCVFKCCD